MTRNIQRRVPLTSGANQREVRDAIGQEVTIRGAYVLRYAYDMRVTASTTSIEAGEGWVLNDLSSSRFAPGNNRGHNFKTGIPMRLRRPLRHIYVGTDANRSDSRYA